MELEKIPTCKLVEELSKREGVSCSCVEPYNSYSLKIETSTIEDSGPAKILVVID